MTFLGWMLRREQGLKQEIGETDFVMKRIYKSFSPFNTWNSGASDGGSNEFGAIFNLEFSPEGNLLAGACEKKSIVLFDPITRKQTKSIRNAHSDNVNCIKFLDSRMFATCSDDTTVALWDIRNLNQKIRSLQGHSNWVKNIDYSQKDGLLVTSGFDGSIYTWDINSYTEQGFIYKKVFSTSGLMRCRLSPDSSKLVICTTGGYLIIIHDLDLTTLARDLSGFKPSLFRLMQQGRQFIPYAAKFDHIFAKSQKRNRVEIVDDFPSHNDAEVVCALQIHPKGLCVLSRNISFDEGSEWTCIHDIQEREENSARDRDCAKKRKHSETEESEISLNRPTGATPTTATTTTTTNTTNSTNSRAEPPPAAPDIWAAEVTVQDRACRTNGIRGASNRTNAYAYVYAISSGVEPPPPRSPPSPPSPERPRSVRGGGLDRFRFDLSLHDRCFFYQNACNSPIHQNRKRLLYYLEELNKGKGFIKEPSFSSDGRIVCSPYGFNVRLLAFTEDCADLSDALHSMGERPLQLREIKRINCHSDIVVSSKFSPRHPLLVTGCLKGSVIWHHPDL